MEESVFERIRRSYPELSDARAKVARFLIEHWEEAAFMSASKLGAAVGVSNTVVIRYAESLGYSGYTELQRSIQQAVHKRLDSFLVKRLDSESKSGDPGSMDSVRERVLESVQETYRRNSQDSIFAAAQMILDAKRIYVLGLRGSHGSAFFLYGNLVHMLGNAQCVSAHADIMFDELRLIVPGDLLIAVTFKKPNLLTYRAVKMAKDWGAKTLVITDDLLCPSAQLADKALPVESTPPSFGHSHVGTLALMDAIMEFVVHLDKPRVRRCLAETEEISRDYHPVRTAEESWPKREV